MKISRGNKKEVLEKKFSCAHNEIYGKAAFSISGPMGCVYISHLFCHRRMHGAISGTKAH